MSANVRSADAGTLLADLHLQGSLFGAAEPAVDESFAGLRRIELDDRVVARPPARAGCAGEQAVFDRPRATTLPWRQRTVTMWERRLPEPRLTAWWTPERRARAAAGPGRRCAGC